MKYYQYEKRERKLKQDRLFNEHLNQKVLLRIGMSDARHEVILFRSCPETTEDGMNVFMADIHEEVLSHMSNDNQSMVSFIDDTDGSIAMIKPGDVSYIRLERVIDG